MDVVIVVIIRVILVCCILIIILLLIQSTRFWIGKELPIMRIPHMSNGYRLPDVLSELLIHQTIPLINYLSYKEKGDRIRSEWITFPWSHMVSRSVGTIS